MTLKETTMTKFKTNTASAALIALMTVSAPMAAFAAPESTSPQQSVKNDPDEHAAKKKADDKDVGSMKESSKADKGQHAYEDADVVDSSKKPLSKRDAKSDS